MLHALALHAVGFLLVGYTWSFAALLVCNPAPFAGGLVAMMLLASWASDAGGYFGELRLINCFC